MENNTQKPVSKHAKKVTIIVVAIIIAISIGAGTFAILRSTSTNNTTQNSDDKTAKTKEASAKYDSALSLMKKGDTTNAKRALEDAQSLYKQASDTSHDKDIQASLSSLNKQDDKQPAEAAPAAAQPASN
jgi:outer membrane protein assembly factor BamD (BamD/ComL family)